MKKRNSTGMTLFELLLMVVILAVIAALAVPSYMDFLKKSTFSTTADMAEVIKQDVVACVGKRQTLSQCVSGKNGIPAAVMPTKTLPGASVVNGVITMVAPLGNQYGAAGKTYILTPTQQANNQLQWTLTGSACQGGFVECT